MAPELSLLDNQKKRHCISNYKGQWLVLFFYPRDSTPGCTVEACQFKNDYVTILEMNSRILGINTNDAESHNQFINEQQLPFPLLSDETGEVSLNYNALFKLGPLKLCKRHSFIIDPAGNVAKIYRKVKPAQHSKEIIVDLNFLQSNATT